MLVRVLILFACGPLVLPPVVCACHAVDCADESDACPAEHDDHHTPGCPALTCADRVPASVTNADVSAWIVAPVVSSPHSEPPIEVTRPTRLPSRFHPSDPPLFLSHCALVR